MTDTLVLRAVEESIEDAIGESRDRVDVGIPILPLMAGASSIAPPWWSFERDMFLRNFWKKSSHLSMMVYTAQNMLVNTPMTVVAKDPSIVSHADQAELLTYLLMNVSEFGESLLIAKTRFVEDYLTQDNGGFMEVIGPGDPAGPIEGLPHAVRHLDSRFCWRTGNPTYPVVYHDYNDNGKGYKLHRTRVVYMSQMTSSDSTRNGVGFSAVSRSLQFAQHLYDIMVHKQEKLGSRPISKMLVGSGFKGSEIMQAVLAANRAMTNQNLSRYSRVVGIGSEDVNAKLDTVDLNDFDPFDESTGVTFAMYGMAASFGIPIQEVWPISGASSGRGGDMQESRQRGKLPAEFHQELDQQLSQKFLPPQLTMVSDWSDDYQDEREALNQDIRSRNIERTLKSESITVRTAREKMLDKGDLERDQFRQMELEAGRLENGQHISVLFYRKDDPYKKLLDLGVEFPTALRSNDKDEMLDAISEAMAKVLIELATTTSRRKRGRYDECLAALHWLYKEYEDYEEPMTFEEMALAPGAISHDIHNVREQAGQAGEKPEKKPGADQQGSGQGAEGEDSQGNKPNVPTEAREGTLVPPTSPKSMRVKESPVDDLIDELENDLNREFAKEEPSRDRLKEIVLLAFLSFYLEGAEMESGMISDKQKAIVEEAQQQFLDSINNILDRKAGGNDMLATTTRIVNHAKSLFWKGFVAAEDRQEEEATWVIGATEKHCGDCLGFDGETKTREEWAKGGKLPQSGDLECTGRYCDCALVPAG